MCIRGALKSRFYDLGSTPFLNSRDYYAEKTCENVNVLFSGFEAGDNP